MAELLTVRELKALLRQQVSDAGSPAKWWRRNGGRGPFSEGYIAHMYRNGDAATLPNVLRMMGFKEVVRYEPVPPQSDPVNGGRG